MFKLILAISLLATALYFLIEKQFDIGVPALLISVIFSKYSTGYYFLGIESLLFSDSDSGSDSFSDSGGGDGGGCGGE
jgi:hypothetical protein